jgi:hypothetical protein
MIKVHKVLAGQNLLDVSVQTTGSLDGLFDLCLANNLMPDDEIELGATLTVPSEIKDPEMLDYILANNITVVTGSQGIDLGSGSFSTGFSTGFEA